MKSRTWEIFLEVYEQLPRQGPGNRACAAKALALCRDLPPSPAVLDLGCGTGGQTLHLAELTGGSITAVDCHAPSIERFQATVAERGLAPRVRPLVGDIGRPDQIFKNFDPGLFDLIWSEGALYNIGIERALHIYRDLLQPGGYMVFTDAVWCKEHPPPEVKALFDLDYPTMGTVSDVLATIDNSDFALVDHFTLPDEAWWDDFYTPMQRCIEKLRSKYSGDAEALVALDQMAEEPEMHRRYSAYYAYEFFVLRK